MCTIGLIGFGQFGELIAQHIARDRTMLVYDINTSRAKVKLKANVQFAAFDLVAKQDAVIVAVPITQMREVFLKLSTRVSPGSLVIDVGSVKVLPAKWMIESFAHNINLVATHPLFGPQSARAGLADLKIAICPLRGNRSDEVIVYAQELGLVTIVTTPEEHDREMAYVQALTHLIGRALVNIKAPDEVLKTPSYQHLLELCQIIRNDSFDLFAAIQTLNPFASEITNKFIGELKELLSRSQLPPAAT
jgi:prephenate dehydrogenase